MPLSKINFKPGVNRESTSYANEGTYFETVWARFRSGYPEKIGGWQNLRYGATYKGVARSLFAWVALNSAKLLGLGTNQKFYVEFGGVYNDITPLRDIVVLGAAPLATTDGSRLVVITDISHETTPGTHISISGADAVAGITLSGVYEILSVIDGDQYTVIADVAASATTTGGGAAVTVAYDINAGSATFTTFAGGWGTGGWGENGWGETPPSGGSVGGEALRLWSQCKYGQNLVFAPRDGDIYYWETDTSAFPRATTLRSKTITLGKVATTATSGGAGLTITLTDTNGSGFRQTSYRQLFRTHQQGIRL